MTVFKNPESINQDCIVCLANARAAMQAIEEIEETHKGLAIPQAVRMAMRSKLRMAWYALHLRKSMCHGLHVQELEPKTHKSE
jgi:hypothetical protein